MTTAAILNRASEVKVSIGLLIPAPLRSAVLRLSAADGSPCLSFGNLRAPGLLRVAIGSLVAFALAWTRADACSIERAGTTELLAERGHFQAPVTINESQIHFLIDTGAQRSYIDADIAARLMLPDRGSRHRRIIGADGKSGRAYPDVTVRQLSFAGVERYDFGMGVADLMERPPSIRGLMGADMLAKYDLEFDYPNRRLNLYYVKDCSSSEFKPWSQPHDVVALKLDARKLSLPVFFDGMPLELILDTGAGSTKISMNAAARLDLDVDRIRREARMTISHGAAGLPTANFAQRFEQVQIGQGTYGNVQINVSEIDVAPYDGLLGLDFLRSRKIWISYATRQLLVERTHRQEPKPAMNAGSPPG